MKSTLKQIAEETGYSISTVSRSLHNSSKISDKTRNEIQRVAQKYGYKITPRKKRTRKKNKQPHFALLSDFRNGEFYAKFYCGYRDASYLENVRVSLMSVKDQRSECAGFVQRIYRENNYDGIILFFPALDREHYQDILKILPQDFPVVSNAQIENPNVTTITFDGYSGGHLAAAHLHRQGYRKLGIIEGPGIKPESRFRFNGFMDYVNRHNELELTWKYDGDYEFECGVRAFHQFRKDSHSPVSEKKGIAEAVFATNDSMALGFLESAKNAGFEIPGDLAVLGYDDLPACIQRSPRLSSINTDFTDLARSTIKTLKDKMSSQEQQIGTLSLVRVTLAARSSTVREMANADLSD